MVRRTRPDISRWIVAAVLLAGAISPAAQPQDTETAPKTETAPPEFAATAPPAIDVEEPGIDGLDEADAAKMRAIDAELDKRRGPDAPEPAPQPVASPPTRSFSFSRSAWQTLAALCLVIATILGLTYLIKTYGRKTPLLAGPALGNVLGRIYLAPRASLHFVQTGDRVLVIGLTQQHMTPIAELDAALFEAPHEEHAEDAPGGPAEAPPKAPPEEEGGFLAQLRRARLRAKRPVEPTPDEAEIAALRRDIQRLRQYLEDTALNEKEPERRHD